MSKHEGPKIILFDLEILPDLQEALKVWPQLSAFPGRTIKASLNSICSFGWKVYGDKKARIKNSWDFKSWDKDVNDDREICSFAYETLKDADAVVTQNGEGFDWRFLQTRLAYHGMDTLPKIQHIDTKRVAKSNLFLFSNSLKHMGEFLGGEKKMDHGLGWDLWVKVHSRDKKHMKIMSEYCLQDVETLESIFTRLKPLVEKMPNFNMWRRDGVEVCTNCGGFDLHSNGKRVTKYKIYLRIQCHDCRTWMHRDLKDRIKK